jgi:hypothetical protein
MYICKHVLVQACNGHILMARGILVHQGTVDNELNGQDGLGIE